MKVLAIETSCDETAAAVVDASTRQILGNVLYSQYPEHTAFKGVVPELASRAHLERLPIIVNDALTQAGIKPEDLDAIAATTGPGLTTALLMGTTFAKTLAVALGKPFLATNHIEGHALSPHLISSYPTHLLHNQDSGMNFGLVPDRGSASVRYGTCEPRKPEQVQKSPAGAGYARGVEFPYLLLLVSGGHTQFVMVHSVGNYQMLGTTVDDAAGEAFDKVGKLLGLPHPAGPAIDKLALTGNPQAIQLPFPKNDKSLDFSFSGLKTAVRDVVLGPNPPSPADVAASFQQRVVSIFVKKASLALEQTGAKTLVAAGGVAANAAIREALQQTCQKYGATFTAPPPKLCTDNAAMIAYAAGLRHLQGLETGTLATAVRPRWPLAEAT